MRQSDDAAPAPRRPGRAACAALLVVAFRLTAGASADVSDRLRQVVPLGADATLEVEVSIGDVRVIGAARDDVAVEIVRAAPSAADLARFPVEIDGDATRRRIRVRQAGTDPRLTAAVRLEVPRRARIGALGIAEGRLEVSDFAGAITADVRRGPIVATRVSGVLRFEAGIGAIDLREVRLDADGLVRARTFNGDLRLGFAVRPADARIMALALNGTVRSDIPLTLRAGWGPRWGETTLGRGEPVVSLDVVTGDIRIEAPGPPRP